MNNCLYCNQYVAATSYDYNGTPLLFSCKECEAWFQFDYDNVGDLFLFRIILQTSYKNKNYQVRLNQGKNPEFYFCEQGQGYQQWPYIDVTPKNFQDVIERLLKLQSFK